MRNLDEFLDKVKEVSGSDYKTSKSIGIANQLIGNWRGKISMPSNKHVIEMCKLANIELGEAILAVEYSRENERPLKQAGFGNVIFLSSISLSSIGMMTLAKMSAMPYAFDAALLLSAGTVYYVKSDGKIFSAEIESKLPHLSRHNLMHLVAANDAQIDQVFTGRQY